MAASVRYRPSELDGILIFIGVVFFATLGIAMWLERRALQHQEVEALKRVYYGLIPVPWLLAGAFAGQRRARHGAATIVETRILGKFAMRGPVPTRRLVVASWRPGHRIERIPVDRGDFDRFSRRRIREDESGGWPGGDSLGGRRFPSRDIASNAPTCFTDLPATRAKSAYPLSQDRRAA